jgi:hypothetical protein
MGWPAESDEKLRCFNVFLSIDNDVVNVRNP